MSLVLLSCMQLPVVVVYRSHNLQEYEFLYKPGKLNTSPVYVGMYIILAAYIMYVCLSCLHSNWPAIVMHTQNRLDFVTV